MSTQSPLDIPRARYGLTMAGVTALGLVCTGAVALSQGADAKTLAFALGTLAIASVATFVPAVVAIGREYWGVAVLFCGTGRSLAVLAIAYMFGQSGVPSRPLFIASVSGAVLILILESAAAIRILARIERRRAELKSPPAGQPSRT